MDAFRKFISLTQRAQYFFGNKNFLWKFHFTAILRLVVLSNLEGVSAVKFLRVAANKNGVERSSFFDKTVKESKVKLRYYFIMNKVKYVDKVIVTEVCTSFFYIYNI